MESQIENKFYVNKGLLNKEFFCEYIRDNVQTNLQKYCDKILNDFEFIEYYSIGCKSNRQACYSELWFLDINMDDILLPVYIEHINTSSSYALSRCNMDEDNEDNNYKSLDEILNWCPNYHKSQINKILIDSLNNEI